VRVAVLALSLVACDSVLGVESLPSGSAAIRETPDCRGCSEQSCAAARDRCIADAKCREIYACTAVCDPANGPVCRRQCAPGENDLWKALDSCRRLNCTDECYGTLGFGRCADSSCACTDDICTPFVRQCVVKAECERRFACLGMRARPVDPDDAISCTYEGDEQGVDELQLVRFCWQGAQCGSCPLASGKMFECTNKFQWARTALEEIDYRLQVSDRLGRGVGEADIRVCATGDCEACTRVIATARTDSKGYADMKIATFGGGFRGCFEVRAPGKIPALWFLGRPLTRQEFLQRVLVVSESEFNVTAGAVGAMGDLMTRGHLMISTRDCMVSPASGITIDLPPVAGAYRFYFRGTETTADGPTDDTGQVALGNLPPGPFTVVMRDKTRELGSAAVRIRAGWITGVYVYPAPIPDGSL
jgi:hypothetical protein